MVVDKVKSAKRYKIQNEFLLCCLAVESIIRGHLSAIRLYRRNICIESVEIFYYFFIILFYHYRMITSMKRKLSVSKEPKDCLESISD